MSRLSVVVAIVALTFAGACGDSSPSSQWGPLTMGVREPGPTALTTGDLALSNVCSQLQGRDRVWLLVWPLERTEWISDLAEIRFTNPDGSLVAFRDGQRLEVGGGEGPGDVLMQPGGPACAQDALWWVAEVRLV